VEAQCRACEGYVFRGEGSWDDSREDGAAGSSDLGLDGGVCTEEVEEGAVGRDVVDDYLISFFWGARGICGGSIWWERGVDGKEVRRDGIKYMGPTSMRCGKKWLV
jgi:hypothetical protein